MTRYRLLPLSLLAILLLVSIMGANQSDVAAQGTNLLQNPSFEGAYSSYIPVTDQQKAACPHGACTTAQMPANWLPWWVSQTENDEPWQNRMPEWKPVCPYQPCPFPERLKDGVQALQYFSFHSAHTAGAWQQVAVPANAVVKLSIWGQAWSSATDETFSDFPSPVNMRVGIDPTGGNNPFSGSIVWSATQNPYDNYSLFEVEASAQGDRVTVFLWSQPTEARKHNDIYWDGASLVQVGQGTGAAPSASGTSGGAVAAPVIVQGGPTATPNANGEIYAEVQGGDSIWGVAARNGLTLDEILELNGLTRDAIVTQGDLLLVGYGEGQAPGSEPPPPPVEPTAVPEDNTETAENTDTAQAVAEGGAGEEAATEATEVPAEPTAPPPPPEPTATAEPTTGTICLRAFEDTNGDGAMGAGEELRSGVAIAISNGQSIVTNYVTNGSEPFCIEGLDAGDYRVTRSQTDGETLTTVGDWAISITPGTRTSVDFGSQMTVAEPAAEIASTDTGTDTATDTTNTEATDTETAVTPEAEESTGWLNWVVGIIVAVAVLLLVGVGLVVFSARRMN